MGELILVWVIFTFGILSTTIFIGLIEDEWKVAIEIGGFFEREFSDKISDIERWMRESLVGRYEGPLGVDLFVDDRCDIYVSEVNLRHTMGMVCVVD